MYGDPFAIWGACYAVLAVALALQLWLITVFSVEVKNKNNSIKPIRTTDSFQGQKENKPIAWTLYKLGTFSWVALLRAEIIRIYLIIIRQWQWVSVAVRSFLITSIVHLCLPCAPQPNLGSQLFKPPAWHSLFARLSMCLCPTLLC